MEKADIIFLQYMLQKGCLPEKRATEIYTRINDQLITLEDNSENEEATPTNLRTVIARINTFISVNDLSLTLTKCEANGDEHLSIISSTLCPIYKTQKDFSKDQMKYFNCILHEILISNEKALPRIVVLNLGTTLEKPINLHIAESFVLKVCKLGYLFELDGLIYLGPRCTAEYANYIQTHYNEYTQICDLCSELVCFGTLCGNCKKLMHRYCLEAFKGITSCPSCQRNFNEPATQASQSTSQPTTSQRASKRRQAKHSRNN